MTSFLRVKGSELAADAVTFDFEGRAIHGRAGETLAAALTAAGERELRRTRRGEPRGIFCGMGVCQECLVEIDGRANQRACMTKLTGPVSVRRQAHLFAPVAPPPEAANRRNLSVLEPDILVIGGGAGGLNAATMAARAGARVLLVDERPQAGGQYYKQPLAAPGEFADDPQFAGGRALIAAAEAAGVSFLKGAQVWGAFEPLDLMIGDGAVSRPCRPKRLIVAAGAYERGLPVPGWTLPGVMTTGAAQTLLRSYRVLPGRRVFLAGNGPLNLQVAVELARAGAEIVAVAELARRPGAWAAGALGRMLTSAPRLALHGLEYLAELRWRGVPVLYGHALAAVMSSAGDGLTVEARHWSAAAGAPRRSYEVDAVCMGYGFMPSNEILRALGCRHDFDAGRGHLVTATDDDGRTSIAEIYAVGDCRGLGGAFAAEADGVLAGLAAARSLGFAFSRILAKAAASARRQRRRHRRFQLELWAYFAAPRLSRELADQATLICRCEELTLTDIASGFAPGSRSSGANKRLTRAGMGRCQGRYCGPILAAIAACDSGALPDEAAHWAPRPPVKPMLISEISGSGSGNHTE